MALYKNIILTGLFLLLSILSFAEPAGVSQEQTLVLAANQYPQQLKKHRPDQIYILFDGTPYIKKYESLFLKKDTITNLKRFTDSLGYGIMGYRLIYGKGQKVDSVLQFNTEFRLTDKAVNLGMNKLRLFIFNKKGDPTDQFVLDYSNKLNKEVKGLDELFRKYTVYTYIDKEKYSVRNVWILSIGIDDYGGDVFRYCESDATAYDAFFAKQFLNYQGYFKDEQIKRFLLLGNHATRDSILSVLNTIASQASVNDYFIFNFSGRTWLFDESFKAFSVNKDSSKFTTYFFPYNVIYDDEIKNRDTADTTTPSKNLISLKTLQEYIQLIPCVNQLFISEAGPSEKFKTEFVKTMMQNSPEIASLLNINRVIIVPNRFGLDELKGTGMGPIAYYLTHLDSTKNIYNIFSNDHRSAEIAYLLKSEEFKLPPGENNDYFSVFFERAFLQQYREIFGDAKVKKRGLDLGGADINTIKSFSGNRHALIIGTDNYRSKDWEKLENPVYDATEVAEVLQSFYNYDVTLLKDPPMDTIYKYLSTYYRSLREDDQFIIYIAGHGDFDEGLLDDGFIVCTDSKSPEVDPLRNTYIQHTKLKKMINKIPAKQVLVLLDICHGGVFDENVLGKTRDNPAAAITNRNVLELLKDKSQYVTRKVLSSVGKESAFDGRAGKHSPFAAYLLKILNARGGAEGIVTLSDIYALLQKASLNETETLKISPHLAGFGQNDPQSEFILIPVEKK
ncbi:MAG TPA: caspase family protein [Chitinophagaceae bacterium]|nr:caspase family protein [Chitinophagaceae bacterium]